MALQNPWVGYFTRTYEQIKDQVLTTMQTLVPEITDHTPSNIFVKMVGIWAGIAEMLGYYVDAMAREAYIGTCRRLSSALAIANQLDYRVHAWVAGTGEVTFSSDLPVTADFLIPAGTQVETADGVRFSTTQDCTILNGQSTVDVPVRQHSDVLLIASFVATGATFQEYQLPTDLADGQVTVKVNGITWLGQETLAYSIAGSRHYVQTVNRNEIPVVRFGDDVMGAAPPTGQPIQVYYYQTQGADGNVGQGSIITIVTPIGVPSGATNVFVTNQVRVSGGTFNEDLESLRKRIPMSLRVMDRAVTRQDYIDSAELVDGVAKAGVVYECGKTVDIYIVPEGGGIASDALCSDTFDYLDPRRMITTQVRVFPAGEDRTTILMDLHVLPGYNVAFVVSEVKAALALFLSYQNQEIQGALYLSDLYEVIEAVDGVGHSLINSVLVKPYAHRVPPTTLNLNWTVNALFPSTQTIKWDLIAISGTQFHLMRNGEFWSTVDVAVAEVTPEINFTINAAAYTVGDTWLWYTYPSNIDDVGQVQLEDPSIFVSLLTDITIITV